MQNGGLDRPERRHNGRPMAVEVPGQSPLGAAPNLVVRWMDFNSELRAPDDVEKAGVDRKTSTTFP